MFLKNGKGQMNHSIAELVIRHKKESVDFKNQLPNVFHPRIEITYSGGAAQLPADLKSEVDSPKNLKHVETHEKNVLPTKEDLEVEKKHEEFKAGIEQFEQKTLRQVSTEEKQSDCGRQLRCVPKISSSSNQFALFVYAYF
uniref:Uncharacterized protein n=1 Tax=Ditylenchus dipsaci TaxID=166011 RepID=A0A915CX47_9BILA